MKVKTVEDVKVAVMESRFDAYLAKDVEAELAVLIEEGVQKLLCDFSPTEYISSAGLRVLLSTAKRLQKSGGKIVLCSLKPYVHEVFETAGFIRIFKIYDSEEEALKSLK